MLSVRTYVYIIVFGNTRIILYCITISTAATVCVYTILCYYQIEMLRKRLTVRIRVYIYTANRHEDREAK